MGERLIPPAPATQPLRQPPREPADRHQRVPDLVRHVGSHLAQRRQSLLLQELMMGTLDLASGLFRLVYTRAFSTASPAWVAKTERNSKSSSVIGFPLNCCPPRSPHDLALGHQGNAGKLLHSRSPSRSGCTPGS